jgi:predicted Zn-dependent protease
MFALDPDSYRVHEVLGQAAIENARPQDAITEYKAALDRAPHHAGLHEELGDLYWSIADTDHALTEYQAELALDPYSFTSNYKLGSLYVTLGQPQPAVAPLTRATQLDPAYPNTYYYLGRAQLELGQDAAGLASLQRASTAANDPKLQSLAFYQLARAYRRLHRTAEADAALAQFRTLRDAAAAAEQRTADARILSIDNRRQLPHTEALPSDAQAAQP